MTQGTKALRCNNIINSFKIPSGYKIFIKNLVEYRTVDIYESGTFQDTRTLYKELPQRSLSS